MENFNVITLIEYFMQSFDILNFMFHMVSPGSLKSFNRDLMYFLRPKKAYKKNKYKKMFYSSQYLS